MNTRSLIIYHAPHCNDGFTAAWIVAKHLEFNFELYPMAYGDSEADDLIEFLNYNTYTHIYIVDFSIKLDYLALIVKLTKASIHILDHHKTAFEEYGYDMNKFSKKSELRTTYHKGQVKVLLRNNLSGAGICWDYFFPLRRVPRLVSYVQDRDLWRFNLTHTRSMHMFFNSREHSLIEWSILNDALAKGSSHSAIVAEGYRLLRSYDTEIDRIVSQAVDCAIDGHRGMMVECEGQYASDVGNELADKCGTYGLCYSQAACGEVMSGSLRSKGSYDVEVLAKKLGGGGHTNAAGFSMSIDSVVQHIQGRF
jgi:oligoribonuclease NrnB/cAMP/cGMP phosphodiesterase (DHH superfamily)